MCKIYQIWTWAYGGKLCRSETRRFVISKQDIVSLPNRTLCHCQTGHCVFAKQDIVCLLNRTLCHCQTGYLFFPTQDIVSLPNRTLCLCQTGHCVFAKQDIVWFPDRTNCRSQTRNFKRPENHEDSSDFDDFWTVLIATTRSIISEIFASPKNFPRGRKMFVVAVDVVVKVYLRPIRIRSLNFL